MKTEIQSTNFIALHAGFKGWLETLKKSKSMIDNYPLGLKEFFIYLENHHNIKHISKIEKKYFEQFKQYLQHRQNLKRKDTGIVNQTINGQIKAVNSFNKYINTTNKTIKYSITADYLPVTCAEKIVLTQKEIKELYNASFEPYPHKPSSVEFGQRDRVIIALLYGCSLRLNEARNIDLADIDFQNKRLIVRKGKGNKQRFVPIPNQHLEDIKAYIQQGRYYFTERHHNKYCRVKTIKKSSYQTDETALLLGVEGTRLLRFTHRLAYLKSKTTIQKHLTPHVMRHTSGTHLYQRGLDLEKIRKIFGHSSIDTTQIYVHISKRLENENEAETL